MKDKVKLMAETNQVKSSNLRSAKQASISTILDNYKQHSVSENLPIQKQSSVLSKDVLQRKIVKVSLYKEGANKNQVKKEMEFLESDENNVFVHISRNVTEKVSLNKKNFSGAVDKGEYRITEDPQNNYHDYIHDNNAHLTIEGRFLDYLENIVCLLSSDENFKKTVAVSSKYPNLNFVVRDNDHTPKDPIKINKIFEVFKDIAIRKLGNRTVKENIPLIEEIEKTYTRNMEVVNHFIRTIPAFKGKTLDDFVHYGGNFQEWQKVSFKRF